MQTAILCREMGWTWEEYMDQPQMFIEIMWDMLQEESKAEIKRQKKGSQ